MVRTQIAVVGVTMEQVDDGLSDLLGDLRHRPEFRAVTARWDEEEAYLLVTLDADGDEVGHEDGAAGRSYDAVLEAVCAIPVFEGDEIAFHMIDAQVLPAP